MSSRAQILQNLRQQKRPFPQSTPPETFLPMVPIPDLTAVALQQRFLHHAETAGCCVHLVKSNEKAIEYILALVGDEKTISSWDLAAIDLPGLAEAFDSANINLVAQDDRVNVGLTGVNAALAATGSILLESGNGRYRAASLLPPIHIALVKSSQLLPDLESWWALQRENNLQQVRAHSNIVIITGPSRTADIAMQLVMGMHGPRELHLIFLNNPDN